MTDNEGEQRQQTRRELIRRAAVAGSVAWVAPAIIESLANPASAASGCKCTTAASYTGANISGIGISTGGTCPPAGSSITITGTNGLTGNSSNVNRCGTQCWINTNGTPNLVTGSVPTYTCSTTTITLPAGCTFGDKGMVSVFFGGTGCAGNYYVENPVPAGYTCLTSRGTNFPGTLSATGTSFNLTTVLPDLSKLSHVNLIYCCC